MMKDTIERTLTRFIGQQNTADTRADICSAIGEYFPNTGDVTTVSMWESMSLKEKALWWFLRKFMPRVVKVIRMQHALLHANDIRSELPLWANDSPKQTLIVNVTFTPTKTTEFVNFTPTTNENGH